MEILKRYRDYIGVTLLTVLALVVILKLPSVSLGVPLTWGGDLLLTASQIKGIIDNGWFLTNPYLGAPFSSALYDFPSFDTLHFALLRVLAFFIPDWIVVMNLFYLQGFVAIANVSVFVLRRMGFSSAISVFASIIFTFTPYHLYRNMNHLFLTAYYIVPISVYICYLLLEEDRVFTLFEKKHLIIHVVWLSMIGLSGLYYAYFSCFFFCVTFVYKCIHKGGFHKACLINTVFYIVLVVSGCVINIIPNLLYWMRNGANDIAVRATSEVQVYALNIWQMLLPIEGHRIPIFSKIRTATNGSMAWVNENSSATLGIISSIGFLLLFAYLLRRVDHEKKLFGVLNLCAVLLATTGGFSSIIAMAFSGIRAYCRISIFIAFFAVVAVCYALKGLETRMKKKAVFACLCALIACVGLFDQTADKNSKDYDHIAGDVAADREFVAEIENNIPEGSLILQLPYMPFPESPPVQKMSDYSHFRGYMYSKSLRWSYGAIKGRYEDAVIKNLSQIPVEEMIPYVILMGYRGIYVDRYGYTQETLTHVERYLTDLNAGVRVESSNGRMVYYDLAGCTPSTLSEEDTQKLYPPLWAQGFHEMESLPDIGNSWIWSEGESTLLLYNPSGKDKKAVMEGAFSTGHASESSITIKTERDESTERINAQARSLQFSFTVKPGMNWVNFSCDARKLETDDPRTLIFSIFNPVIWYE